MHRYVGYSVCSVLKLRSIIILASRSCSLIYRHCLNQSTVTSNMNIGTHKLINYFPNVRLKLPQQKRKYCINIILILVLVYQDYGDRGSSVGIATRYGLDGAGIESRWGGEHFPTRLDRPWGPPSLLQNGYRVSFPGVKWPGGGVHHPPLFIAEVKERV